MNFSSISIYSFYPGGIGGPGGDSSRQGGPGGTGGGPNVHTGVGDMLIYQGSKEEEPGATRRAIIDWFSPINFFQRHDDIKHARAKGTGKWLVHHPSFTQWESGSNNTLWCDGIR